MMPDLAVIGVPSSAGARRTGQERAPQSFRREGLVDRLRAAGLRVVDLGDLPQVTYTPDLEHPKSQNAALVRQVVTQLSEAVDEAVLRGARPVVMGGDCTITLGVLSGLVRHFPRLGLMYFDGDLDLHTPATTISGILDGMGMAHIIGKGLEELTHIGPRYPLMPEERIVLFGFNLDAGWVDPPELDLLRRSSMLGFPTGLIRKNVVAAAQEALALLEVRTDQILVHFDVDVLAYDEFPAAEVPHSYGLTLAEAVEALQVFAASPKFAGLVITEFNAEQDVDGALAGRLVDVVSGALGGGKIHWKTLQRAAQPRTLDTLLRQPWPIGLT